MESKIKYFNSDVIRGCIFRKKAKIKRVEMRGQFEELKQTIESLSGNLNISEQTSLLLAKLYTNCFVEFLIVKFFVLFRFLTCR